MHLSGFLLDIAPANKQHSYHYFLLLHFSYFNVLIKRYKLGIKRPLQPLQPQCLCAFEALVLDIAVADKKHSNHHFLLSSNAMKCRVLRHFADYVFCTTILADFYTFGKSRQNTANCNFH